MSEKISIEQAKELALSGGWGKSKKKKGEGQKYNNNSVQRYGLTFDSELELFAYELLKKFKFKFEFQYKHELQPTHVGWDGQTVRRINMFVDFRITTPDGYIYFDTKGFETEESKLKYKMLSYQKIVAGEKHQIVWKHKKDQVMAFIIDLKKKYYG